mgnify:CR=1 FL=1|jgi:GT2 family glycosyltransferase
MNEPLPDNVVISTINWNSENHTIKLIDSLLSANLENCKVVICDNGSSDSSYKNLKSHLLKMDWISQKKIEVESDQIESIQHLFGKNGVEFILLKLFENYGFAKANNIAYRYVDNFAVFEYFWILNNDTTITTSSMSELISNSKKNHNNIILSSLIYDADDVQKIWFSGGVYNKYLAKSKHVSYTKFKISKYQYLSGCSMFVPVQVISKIGLLNENYLIYGEDIEYSMRATKNKIPLGIVESSIVFHVGGGSVIKRSYYAYHLYVRNTVSVIIKGHTRFFLLSIIPYHLSKVVYLFLFKSVPFSSLKGYIIGFFDAIFKR